MRKRILLICTREIGQWVFSEILFINTIDNKSESRLQRFSYKWLSIILFPPCLLKFISFQILSFSSSQLSIFTHFNFSCFYYKYLVIIDFLFPILIRVLREYGFSCVIANEHVRIDSSSYERVKTFKFLGCLLTNQNSIQEEICKI